MLFELKIPKLNEIVTTVLIEKVYAEENTLVAVGSKILDLSLDLSGAFSQNCPPISYYRLVVREKVWFRKILVAAGDHCEVETSLGVFSTEADEPLDLAPARAVRVMTAGIVHHDDMWSGSEG